MAYSSPGKQKGLALLVAMLIVVLVATVAVSILHEEKFTLRKTAHIQGMDRARLYAIGLEDWARVFLRKDREKSDIDSLDEDWAIGVPGLPIEGGYLAGYLEDEQAKFNLNSVVVSDLQVERFRRLCRNLEVDDIFIPALIDWIDQDFEVTYPDGMEENYQDYRVANRELTDISELLLVHNVTPEMYEKLKPYITALPATTTINVNTMSEVIFRSLGEEGDVKQFIEAREEEAYSSVEDFVERLQLPIDAEGLSVGTNFFRAHGQVVQGEQVVNLNTLVYRDDKGGTSIYNRSLGLF
ncbi:MAG TPA: type II secretion system minor pseudopilin GspK [Gammaproteobacteria bacterium]|nr:type II secretion system minor pseudopilin GspK [Gammaproteobacteria bacterium]